MQIKRAASNVLSIVLFLTLVIVLASLFFKAQSGASSPVVLSGLQQPTPTPFPFNPLPPTPTPNPTEIAEENLPVPTLPLTVISPEAHVDVGVTDLRPLAQQESMFLGWSPDSSLALVRRKSQNYTLVQFANGAGVQGTIGDLWVVDINGNDVMKVSDIAYAWLWSPDSKSVLFSEPANPQGGSEGNLIVADLSSGQARSIAKIELVPWLNMQWLPTDRIYLSQGSSLYRISPEGADFSAATPLQLAPLYVEGATGGSTFRICADESKIAYNIPTQEGNELWIANLDGSDATRVIDWVSYFEWKPDCSQLVFSSIHKYAGTGFDSSIMTVGRDGKNPQEVVAVSQRDEVNSFPQWASSGDWIVYVRQVPDYSMGWQEYQIWKVTPDGSRATLLVEHAGPIPYISADGRWLAFNTYVARRPDILSAFVAQIDLSK